MTVPTNPDNPLIETPAEYGLEHNGVANGIALGAYGAATRNGEHNHPGLVAFGGMLRGLVDGVEKNMENPGEGGENVRKGALEGAFYGGLSGYGLGKTVDGIHSDGGIMDVLGTGAANAAQAVGLSHFAQANDPERSALQDAAVGFLGGVAADVGETAAEKRGISPYIGKGGALATALGTAHAGAGIEGIDTGIYSAGQMTAGMAAGNAISKSNRWLNDKFFSDGTGKDGAAEWENEAKKQAEAQAVEGEQVQSQADSQEAQAQEAAKTDGEAQAQDAKTQEVKSETDAKPAQELTKEELQQALANTEAKVTDLQAQVDQMQGKSGNEWTTDMSAYADNQATKPGLSDMAAQSDGRSTAPDTQGFNVSDKDEPESSEKNEDKPNFFQRLFNRDDDDKDKGDEGLSK